MYVILTGFFALIIRCSSNFGFIPIPISFQHLAFWIHSFPEIPTHFTPFGPGHFTIYKYSSSGYPIQEQTNDTFSLARPDRPLGGVLPLFVHRLKVNKRVLSNKLPTVHCKYVWNAAFYYVYVYISLPSENILLR